MSKKDTTPTPTPVPAPVSAISATDLALFNKALKALESANTIHQFTIGHLVEVYGLQQGDRVDPTTGVITRVQNDEDATGLEA